MAVGKEGEDALAGLFHHSARFRRLWRAGVGLFYRRPTATPEETAMFLVHVSLALSLPIRWALARALQAEFRRPLDWFERSVVLVAAIAIGGWWVAFLCLVRLWILMAAG
jgi:hypothetical protein